MITLVVPLVSHVDLRKNVNVRIVHQRNHPIFAQDVVIPMEEKIMRMEVGPVIDVEMKVNNENR
jgi:hypothetical protein